MDIKEQIKKIDDFFNNLSIEEFEKMAIEAGINEIKSSNDYGMKLLLDSKDVAYMKNNFLYSKDTKYASIEENDLSLFSICYVEAA